MSQILTIAHETSHKSIWQKNVCFGSFFISFSLLCTYVIISKKRACVWTLGKNDFFFKEIYIMNVGLLLGLDFELWSEENVQNAVNITSFIQYVLL